MQRIFIHTRGWLDRSDRLAISIRCIENMYYIFDKLSLYSSEDMVVASENDAFKMWPKWMHDE